MKGEIINVIKKEIDCNRSFDYICIVVCSYELFGIFKIRMLNWRKGAQSSFFLPLICPEAAHSGDFKMLVIPLFHVAKGHALQILD